MEEVVIGLGKVGLGKAEGQLVNLTGVEGSINDLCHINTLSTMAKSMLVPWDLGISKV